MRRPAFEVPLAALSLARDPERDDADDAGVGALDNPLDHATLSRSVTALEEPNADQHAEHEVRGS